MTTSPSRRRTPRAVAGLLVAWFALGIVPGPASASPATEIATAPLELSGLGVSTRAWSLSERVCAPFRFTMAAVTWRGPDEAAAALTWGDGFARAEGEGHEGPDARTREANEIEGTPAVWTGERRCLNLKVRAPDNSPLLKPRVVFLNTSGTAFDVSPLAAAGSAVAQALSSVLGWMSPSPASAWTDQPGIIMRPQWGANEALRNCGPDYMDEVRVAYVHHTASGNRYGKDRADDVLRGIYAYHTNSRGYCDIAYNFLIDKWGRIYEGRAGGIDQPVQGGHAMGFNTGSTGIAAIGTFSRARPPAALIRAFRRLIRWRLDVAHRNPNSFQWMVSAGGSNQKFDAGESVFLRAVIPHRRTGYTDCPGNRLARYITGIRKGAAKGGHPKIYDPSQSTSDLVHGESQVSWAATVSSSDATWRIDVSNQAGSVVRTLTGGGSAVSALWDGTGPGGLPVPDGDYLVAISATRGSTLARPASFEVRVCTLSEPGTTTCPEPEPEPEP